MRRIVAACVVLIALVGCDSDNNDDAAVPPSTTLAFGTTDISAPPTSEQGVVTRVAVGAHAGFTRVVFGFAEKVPSFAVKNAQPPFVQDGSGKTVTVAGSGHLAVRLMARAHDDNGQPTIGATVTGPSGGSVPEVVLVGDFEGIVNFVIGTTKAPAEFRAYTLANPPRFVVDVAD